MADCCGSGFPRGQHVAAFLMLAVAAAARWFTILFPPSCVCKDKNIQKTVEVPQVQFFDEDTVHIHVVLKA